MNLNKKWISAILYICAICVSCTACSLRNNSANKEKVYKEEPVATVSDDAMYIKKPGELIQKGKNYQINRTDENDKYRCQVFNDKGQLIYSEEFTTIVEPTVSLQYGAVDIHHGVGTGTYLDKFIDYENNRKSSWIENVRAIGKEQVAYVRWEDNADGKTDTLLVVAPKYKYDTERKCVFPYVSDEWDIDRFEFRNDETELYLHYINKDTKKPAAKTIKLSEFTSQSKNPDNLSSSQTKDINQKILRKEF